MIALQNGCYLTPDGKFTKGDVIIENSKLKLDHVSETLTNKEDCLDMEGLFVLPGLIDVHIHGAAGHDVMNSTPGQIKEMAGFLARNGVTSFVPTTMTAAAQSIKAALGNIKKASEMDSIAATIAGVHIEGPYINALQRGCHNPALIKPPDIEEFYSFRKIIGDDLKLRITVAPEVEGAMEYIKEVSVNGGSISLGHTDADSKIILEAVKNGAVSFTHLFNAMKGLHHREPGTAGAALAGDSYVELICDGIHVHPDIINLVYKIKGTDKIILITDSIPAAGMGDGEYRFGGYKVLVSEGQARNGNGALAGSTITLWQAVKNIMGFTGASLEAAVRMASINPARLIGLDNITGSIEEGKRADLFAVNKNLDIVYVFCKGRMVYKK
ncbi:MAG: N-acetylglucosamine-6-phosphate deacetylase [Bacillota bacterium]|nr:N-acetylglucosamine-6-phosphate deacetylase [Bacillota bacterium]